MGTQNLNNYYFNRLDTKINYSSYYDIFLASDEKDFNQQVVYSTSIIDATSGNSLPVWIDLADPDSGTQPVTNCVVQTASTTGFVILSKVYWPNAKSTCECPYTGTTPIELCDIIWTGTDNGLVNPTSGDCIDLYDTLPGAQQFNKFSYDKRFKMVQVKALTPAGTLNPTIDTSIVNAFDSSGYYQELRGGLYQGFYKLYGYPYEVLPTRPNRGWSFETYLKINSIGNTGLGPDDPAPYNGQQGNYGNCYNTSGWNSFTNYLTGTTLNVTFSAATLCIPPTMTPFGPNPPQTLLNYNPPTSPSTTGGFFFYKGIRAEDKWGFTGSNIDNTFELSACTTLSGVSGCCMTEEDSVRVAYQNKSPNAKYDVYSNALGFRITDDMKIGYRTVRYTGTCETTGSTELCNTGMTFECGYTIEESYSDPICTFITQSDNCNDTWIQVDVVFKRNLELEDCEIFNNGGINDLVRVRVDKFQRYGTHKDGGIAPFGCNPVGVTPEVNPCKDQYPRFIEDAYFDFNCHGAYVHKWFEEKEYRLGTLTFYINGRRVHTVENYEEIIPRQLNTNKQTQMGVAYNMSWGGGALGLSSSMFSMSCDTSNWTSFVPNSDQTLIRNNFGGTFIGGISQMMYYIKPLTPDEIYHNFLINKNRYSLIDCEECKNCDSGCVDCDLPEE